MLGLLIWRSRYAARGVAIIINIPEAEPVRDMPMRQLNQRASRSADHCPLNDRSHKILIKQDFQHSAYPTTPPI